MGCSSSKETDAVENQHKMPTPEPISDTGADEYRAPPEYGANELPPMEHEYEFETNYQIAWIIDDAVPKTKPLPKKKKVVQLPPHNPLDLSEIGDDEDGIETD